MIYLCCFLDEKAPKFNDAIKKDCLASNWKFKPCDAPNDFYCYFEGSTALYEIFNDALRFPKIKNYKTNTTLDILFCQMTTFIKVRVTYVFGLQTLKLKNLVKSIN